MKKNTVNGVLVLVIFAVFMVCVLFVLLSGADTVQRLTDRDQRTYDHRTAVQYIATRVHQADRSGAVSVEDATLVLTEEINGQLYQTRVYCHEGYLREMFCPTGAALAPEFGEEILPMQDFRVTCQDDLLRVTIVMADDSTDSLCLYLRSEGGTGYEE